jgi:Na+-translocating ferredoxin:NAD+ oxidoreductase RnfC subunit
MPVGFRAVSPVVVYGVDAEPLARTSRHLLTHQTDRVVDGLALLVANLGAERGVVCLPGEESGLQARAAAALKKRENLKLIDFEETALLRPAAVARPESLLKLSEAADGRPPTSAYVSCAGEVREPGLLRVPLGTPLREVIAACGGPVIEHWVLLVGDVLTGEIEHDLDRPVDGDTRGLLLLPAEHPLVAVRSRSLAQLLNLAGAVCSGCGFCTSYCPAALDGEDISPHLIMRQLSAGLAEPEETLKGALACRECGVCEAVCVMSLSPWRLNRVLKQRLQQRLQPELPDRQPAMSTHFAQAAAAGRRPPESWYLARLGLESYGSRELCYRGELDSRKIELELPPGSTLRVARGDAVMRDEPVADAGDGRTLHAGISGYVLVAEEQRLIIAAEKGEIP